jgi:tellurite resistance protein TerC
MPIESVGSPLLWAGFLAFVVGMLALDLGVFHKRAHAVSVKEAALWSVAWISLAALFNVGVYALFGPERALEFAAGYLLEKALAVDNIFVFVIIFSSFGVSLASQHRVLFWGVLGALLMRAVFIVVGAALIQRFHWVMYIFGALLVITGAKLLVQRAEEAHPERNPLLTLFRKWVPVTHEHAEGQFIVKRAGKRYATPLLLALVAVEVSDLVFAIDSIPAVFAVTTDPFIVFTSNIFAILGLRSLYFLIADIITRFAYLKIGLAVVLMFVGVKMLIADLIKVPILVSLGVIISVIAVSIAVSWLKPPRPKAAPAGSVS